MTSSNGLPTTELPDSVSIVIPTYNERLTIERVVARCLSLSNPEEIEVIVVDDRSPDGTARLVRQEFDSIDHVRVIVPDQRQGLGSSVLRGFDAASGRVLVKLDGDLQHPPYEIPRLLRRIGEKTDVVVGSRYVAGGKSEVGLYRRLLSKSATAFAKLLVPRLRPFSDPLSGYYALQKESYDLTQFSKSNLKPLLNILVQTPVENVSEIPYTFSKRPAGNSKLGPDSYTTFLRQLRDLRSRTE